MCGITPCRRINEWCLQRKCTSIHRSILQSTSFRQGSVMSCHLDSWQIQSQNFISRVPWNVDGCRKDPTKGANQGGLSYDTSDLDLSQRHVSDGTTEPSGKLLETNPPNTRRNLLFTKIGSSMFTISSQIKRKITSMFQVETCLCFQFRTIFVPFTTSQQNV